MSHVSKLVYAIPLSMGNSKKCAKVATSRSSMVKKVAMDVFNISLMKNTYRMVAPLEIYHEIDEARI
ncbi:hypothetical protein M0804_007636 [Polistes exclamans]|nr:hypothetical protein M0804_007636 [Polistes exclamans]